MAIQTFAAIDVGSFELELSIYEISNKFGVRPVDHVRHVIALGSDTYSTGKIGYQLVEEMCRVLKDFSEIMKGYKVQAYRAYATSALRDAKNNQIILDQIEVRTGLQVQIISNSEQRFLGYKAIAANDQEFNTIIQKGTAIVDIGFGSMQISLFDKDALVSTQNLALGALRIREQVAKIPANRQKRSALIEEVVDNELMTFKKLYLRDREIKNLIGIGDNSMYWFKRARAGVGTVQTKMTAEDVNQFYEILMKTPPEELESRYGLSEKDAELMLPGAVIYKRLLEITGAELFWLPGIRLGDGIAAEYAEEACHVRFKHSFENDILAAAKNMAKRYRCQASHNQVLEGCALGIFDAMRRYHGLTGRDRLLLQIAVQLHACGKFISLRNANECAYNIIMSTEIIGLSHLEREMVANVVRYNIRDFAYNQLQLEMDVYRNNSTQIGINEITIKIAKLTAILRLANSMDRSHRAKLSGCKIAVKEGELVVATDYSEDLSIERMSFDQKADFFEEIFGIRPVLKQKNVSGRMG